LSAQHLYQRELLLVVVGALGLEFADYSAEAEHDCGLANTFGARDEQACSIALALPACAYLDVITFPVTLMMISSTTFELKMEK
jgi:hypothetical protein